MRQPRRTQRRGRAARPRVGTRALTRAEAVAIVAFADLSSTSPDVAGDEPETTEPAVEPLIPAAVFDSRDVNVTPPVTLRLRLPSLGQDDLAQAGVVETIVSASGEVEKVKLVSPPQSVHEAMILSAIKTWRFQPAMKRRAARPVSPPDTDLPTEIAPGAAEAPPCDCALAVYDLLRKATTSRMWAANATTPVITTANKGFISRPPRGSIVAILSSRTRTPPQDARPSDVAGSGAPPARLRP